MTAPKPRRRWFQFRLRTLFVLMVLASIGLSWFAVKMQQAKRQREAVEAIKSASGWVCYDFEWDGQDMIPDAVPQTPAWLRESLGDDFFSTVVWAEVSDDAIDHLKALPQLQHLSFLPAVPPSVDRTAYIQGLSQLTWLDLSYSEVTDDRLRVLNTTARNIFGTATP
jgi:hypothetical protein